MVDLIESIICHGCPYIEDCGKEYIYECVIVNEDIYEGIRGVRTWLSSFDTSSATKCFEAVNLLKQRLEGEDGR